GALEVSGAAKFSAGLEVSELGTASSTISVLSDTYFFGRPYFTSDTGGSARIAEGAATVEIVFDREYVEKPVITASMVFNDASTTDEAIEKIFDENIAFLVTKRTVHGFTIRLNKKAPADISFNWMAIAVKDSKEFTSRSVDGEATPVVSASETPIATTTPPADTATSTPDTATSTPETATVPPAEVPEPTAHEESPQSSSSTAPSLIPEETIAP
ncbi:hypothetical protein KW797_04620, partial [Candidatus Parcubacteria bacterium]|nr:hypothetical protein [Candidatus Parcubacteria bacterium]